MTNSMLEAMDLLRSKAKPGERIMVVTFSHWKEFASYTETTPILPPYPEIEDGSIFTQAVYNALMQYSFTRDELLSKKPEIKLLERAISSICNHIPYVVKNSDIKNKRKRTKELLQIFQQFDSRPITYALNCQPSYVELILRVGLLDMSKINIETLNLIESKTKLLLEGLK